ncbi:MAG: sigma-70 family RNA polymerase sigma factor [Phycisphaerales bacterium]|jgi:RNA polymerase sigma factor (sigma-70 family)|nr:sigma-70 family RNA polymerase sigma factor [Phycisphaerales bacterium]
MPRKPRQKIHRKLSTATVVETLRKRSQEELCQIELALQTPITAVESPLIKKKNAKRVIFDEADSIPRASIGWYAPSQEVDEKRKASSGKVLTREEEVSLFRQYNFARWRVSIMQKRIQNAKPVTDKEYDELLHWFTIAIDRRDLIVEYNLPLVLAMAQRSCVPGEYSDLVAEGNVAIVRCVDRFDCERGFKFSTYACRALYASFNRFGKKQLKHKAHTTFEIDPDRELRITDSEVDRSESDELRAIRKALRSDQVELTSYELEVMRLRYGLNCPQNAPHLTLQKIGEMLGISKERVRQIQLTALSKIRDVANKYLPTDLAS